MGVEPILGVSQTPVRTGTLTLPSLVEADGLEPPTTVLPHGCSFAELRSHYNILLDTLVNVH